MASLCLGLLASWPARADLTLVNAWPGFARAKALDVAVAGTRAYLAMGNSGLTILDISQPTQPVAARQIPFSYYEPGLGTRTDSALWVESYGDWVFVGTWGKGVRVLDARNPGYAEVGLIPASEVTTWVKGRFEGRYGYFEGGGAISIYDLTAPARPLRVGQASLPAPVMDLCVQDGIVYAVRYASVYRVDVRDPAHPTGLTAQRLAVDPADANRIIADGAYVYFSAATSKKVLVLDPGLLEAGQPAVVAGALTVGSPNAIAVGANHLIVGEDGYGLRIYEKPTPGLINYVDRPVASIPMAGGPFHLQLVGDTAVVVDQQNQPNQATAPDGGSPASLQVFNLSDPVHPTRTGAFPTYGTASQLEVWGDHAFLADGPSGVTVLNVQDPDHPTYVTTLSVKASENRVAVRDGLAYAVSSTSVGLRWILVCDIFDVHDPANAMPVSHLELVAHQNYQLGLGYSPLRLAGHLLVVGWTDSNGDMGYFELLDVADPRNPRAVGRIPLERDSPLDTAVVQGHLALLSYYYGTSGFTLRLYNLDDPASPRLLNQVGMRFGTHALAARGDTLFRLYGSPGDWGFSAFDLSTLAALKVLSTRNTGVGDNSTLDLDGKYLYLAGSSGVEAWDVSDPSAPVLSGSRYYPFSRGGAQRVRFANGRLLVAEDGHSGGGSTGQLFTFGNLPGQVAPEITQQPQGQSVPQGKPVTFTVAAQGSGTLRHQWRKDGQDIAGATGPSLTIAAVTPADAGRYTVVVRNAAGGAPSQEAVLTVIVPPSISVQPVGGSAQPGGHVELKVAAAGSVESAAAQFAAVEVQMFASVVLRGSVGSLWRLEFTTDVTEPMHWQPAATVTLTSSPQAWVDAASAGQPKRFYRAVPGP